MLRFCVAELVVAVRDPHPDPALLILCLCVYSFFIPLTNRGKDSEAQATPTCFTLSNRDQRARRCSENTSGSRDADSELKGPGFKNSLLLTMSRTTVIDPECQNIFHMSRCDQSSLRAYQVMFDVQYYER